MRMTFVRHGEMAGDPFAEPPAGVNGCLSERGVAQAEAAREALSGEHFDIAYASSYGRARQTAEIVMAPHGLPIRILEFLREWQPNRELDELPATEAEAIRARTAAYYAEDTWKTELGEGCLEILNRVGPPFLKVLAGQGIHQRHGGYVIDPGSEERSLIVFAHGGSLNALLTFLLRLPPFPVELFSFELAGVLTLVFNEAQGVHYPAISCRARTQS